SERFSTIGKERASNPMLRVASEEEFVARMTADLPPRPEYFFRDVELNRQGAEALSNLPLPPALAPEQVRPAGAVILDTRPLIEFAAAHVPGSIHIGLSGQYASWAARLIGLDTDIVLVAEDTERVRESQIRLARVGIQRVCGYLAQGVTGWARAGLPLEQMPQVSVQELHRQLQDPDGLVVLDVREKSEWAAGTIAGSVRIPLGELAGHVEELSRDALIAVHCKSGYRSSIAASLLQKAGFVQVANVTGGFDAWKGANLPLELPRGAPQSCGA
ncbi:MAG: MBL fold metallo-hydrolase, partial [Acidobacteria bacterium]|nr:MBL fold metallo-hydrolase [Acidobacteriota bacterium]